MEQVSRLAEGESPVRRLKLSGANDSGGATQYPASPGELPMTQQPATTPLAPADEFVRRHVGPTADELGQMLATLGVDSLDVLLDETLPEAIRDDALELPPARSEPAVLAALRTLAD